MARRVDDELVILDVKSGRYFSLNDVGALVWDRLERDCTRHDLVDAVIADYEVDHDEASQDVDELIEQLANAGLVTR
jgi:hypothetical protein